VKTAWPFFNLRWAGQQQPHTQVFPRRVETMAFNGIRRKPNLIVSHCDRRGNVLGLSERMSAQEHTDQGSLSGGKCPETAPARSGPHAAAPGDGVFKSRPPRRNCWISRTIHDLRRGWAGGRDKERRRIGIQVLRRYSICTDELSKPARNWPGIHPCLSSIGASVGGAGRSRT
jgi:hypothetical protein